MAPSTEEAHSINAVENIEKRSTSGFGHIMGSGKRYDIPTGPPGQNGQ